VSESSVVPVKAGVRAGVVGWSVVLVLVVVLVVAVSEIEVSSSSSSFLVALAIVVTAVVVVIVVFVVFFGGRGGEERLTSLGTFLTAAEEEEGLLFSARVGVLASSGRLAEELL
jgi:hypothetical protein